MFKDLHSVDWKRLEHGYGSAEDIPSRLALLADESPEQQQKALFGLWESIYHQGSRFEASPFVVPFLFELLATAAVPLQHQLIDLLQGLAVGLGETFLPYGYDLKMEEKKSATGVWPRLFENEPARASYFEVQRQCETFVGLLDPSVHPESRLSASFTIAHFAEHLAHFHEEVSRYALQETDPMQFQGQVLCFGMLGRHANKTPDTTWLVDCVNTSDSPTARVCASIALTTIHESSTPDVARKTLLTAVAQAWKLDSPRYGGNWWNEGDLLGYVAMVLPMLGEQRRAEIAFVLSESLEKMDTCTFVIPQTLLDLLFPGPKPTGGWKVAELDELQRGCLARLLKTRHWRSWMLDSLFFSEALVGDAYQQAVQQLIEEVIGEDDKSQSNPMDRMGNVSSWDFENRWPKD